MSIRRWKINKPDLNLVSSIIEHTSLSELAAKLLASRGITPNEAKGFIQADALGDPFEIVDMDKAVMRINTALEIGERICIFGDYDCDGVCATVILEDYLQNAGADVWHYIPDRAKGYGMNEEAIREIAKDGTNLIITVDNGISAIEEAKLIYELGMELIVTDHHQVGESLPKAEAIVNPHRYDDSSFDGYCGAGVAFRLVCALEDGDNEFVTEQYGDIAALATVGDIVPLLCENRTIVKNGLSLIENTNRLGLASLIEQSGAGNSVMNSNAVAYRLVPRINAAGRFSNAELAVKLLMSEDEDEANSLAVELCEINEKRRAEEAEIFAKIEEQIQKNPHKLNNRVIVFAGEGWHYGVLGIVAARLLEMYRKPVIVLNIEDGYAHGSARSIDGFSIYDALCECSSLLEKFGGHHKAGGLTLREENIEKFEQMIEDYAYKNFKVMPKDYAVCDLAISPNEMTVASIKSAQTLEPFGEANPKPVYAILNAKITAIRPIKEGKYTQITLDYGGVLVQVISFRIPTKEFCYKTGDIVDLRVTADINEYKGNERISLTLLDIRPSNFNEDKYFIAKSVYEDMKSGKGIEEKFLKRVIPSRDDMVKLYKLIKDKTVNCDNLYFEAVRENISYAMMMTAIDAFCECGLAQYDYSKFTVTGIKSDKKVDLMNAKALTSIKEKVYN